MERLREVVREGVEIVRAEDCGYSNCLDGDKIVVISLRDLGKLGNLERHHVVVVLPEQEG